MFNVRGITEKILVYFRKHSKRYRQTYRIYLAIQRAKLWIERGSQVFLCVALAQGLDIGCKEEVAKRIPEFNFKWIYERMPEEYKPNHPRLYETNILELNRGPRWPLGETNYVWWLSRDLEWNKKVRLKALEILEMHYSNKLDKILQGEKI